jgi:hypothetical protein
MPSGLSELFWSGQTRSAALPIELQATMRRRHKPSVEGWLERALAEVQSFHVSRNNKVGSIIEPLARYSMACRPISPEHKSCGRGETDKSKQDDANRYHLSYEKIMYLTQSGKVAFDQCNEDVHVEDRFRNINPRESTNAYLSYRRSMTSTAVQE